MPEIRAVSFETYEMYLSQYGIPISQDFFGRDYTLERVDRLLKKPIYIENIMSPRDQFHFGLTLRGKRENVHLKPAFKPNPHPWYRQGPEPTCLSWAVANGLRSQGIRPDIEMMAYLLNTNNKRGGLDYIAAWSIADRYSGLNGFSFDKPKVELVPNMPFLNSSIIKQSIDRSQTILTSVKSSLYEGRVFDCEGEVIKEDHAVCIARYEIDEDGAMNVQIIDSNFGKIWISLEYLSISLSQGETYLIGRA